MSDQANNESYIKMLELLENQDLIFALEETDCPICFSQLQKGQGVVLRGCLHVFCKECLVNWIQSGNDSTATVKCPYQDEKYTCEMELHQREIKALVPPNVFQNFLGRSLKLAESQAANSFHCKTPDCIGWWFFDPARNHGSNSNIFLCPVCNKKNCLSCAATHEGMKCDEYKKKLAKQDVNDKKSLDKLEKMIELGEAMRCPSCKVPIVRDEGCDSVTCTKCNTMICWATKGFRWGKGGIGDSSGGCKCNVNGKLCHPNCRNCH